MILRNSKPLITELNEEQLKLFKDLGFYVNRLFSSDREIKIIDKFLQKDYSCCGGTFTLQINITYRHILNGKEVGQTVKIKTPYNSWWSRCWNVLEFTKDMEEFQKELQEDLKILRKNKIIS